MQNQDKEIAKKTMPRWLVGILLFFSCLVAAVLSLTLVYYIPVEPMEEQLEESAATLLSEGNTTHFMAGDVSGRVDNFTTAIMLNIAGHKGDNPLAAALNASRYIVDENDPVADFAASIGNQANVEYSRYWHGYLLVLKPLLLFMNLLQLRTLFLSVTTLLLIVTSILLSRRLNFLFSVSFAFSFCIVNFFVAALSLPLAFSLIVALIGVLIVAWKTDEGKPLFSEMRFGVTFFLLGAATVFLDFLDTPIITLGLPLAVYVTIRAQSISAAGFRTVFFKLLLCCASWAVAYFGLFAAKWLLVFFLVDPTSLTLAINKILFRTQGSWEGYNISGLGAVVLNVKILVSSWLFVLYFLFGALWLLLLIRFRSEGMAKPALLLALICLMPIVWYLVLANHSTIHAWFTYRDLLISLLAFAFMVLLLLDTEKLKGTLLSRHATVSKGS